MEKTNECGKLSYNEILRRVRKVAPRLDITLQATLAAKVYEIQRKSNWAYDTNELINRVVDNLDFSLTKEEIRAQINELLKVYLSPQAWSKEEEEAQFISYATSRLLELREKMEIEGLAEEEKSELEQIIETLRPYVRYPEIRRLIEELEGADWRDLFAPPAPKKAPSAVKAPIEPTGAVQLREYQRKALEAWYKAGRVGTIVLPTGAGKTYVGLAAASDFLAQGLSVLILVPTKVLALQWAERVRAVLGLEPCVLFSGAKNGARASNVTIAVYNTALKRGLTADLVIVDEGHHAHRRSQLGAYVKQLIERGAAVLALTATPEGDNLVPVVYTQRASELLGSHLADIRVVAVAVPLEPRLARVYEELTEKIRQLARLREDGDWSRVEEQRYQRLCALRRIVLSSSPAKLNALARIVAAHAAEEKVIIWTESIKAAENIAAQLGKVGARVIHHKLDRAAIQRALAAWGKEFNVLIACRMLDEGVDVPDVRVGIIHASGAVLRRAVQRAGRLLRPKDKPALLYVLASRGTYEEAMAQKLARYYERPATRIERFH